MLNENKLIELLKINSESAFVELYNKYSPVLFGICLRYAKERTEAEDILQESFIKIYENIESFKSEGSLEGWLKRIVVNVSINHYRKKIKENTVSTDDEITYEKIIPENVFSELTSKELISLIQLLPEGYRMVFNLYAIEGFKHNEIAELLGYTESTSKTQLMKAKKILQQYVFKLYPKIAKAYIDSDKDKKLIFDF